MKKEKPETQSPAAASPDEMPNAATPANSPAPAEAVTPEPLEDLKARAAKADEHWQRLLRTAADFENFKKRAAREKHEAVKFANEALIQKLLPILDNFDMALAATQAGQNDTAQSLQTGVSMILQQLKTVLTEAGLEEVDANGQTFDPNLHEAVSQQETPDTPEGRVVQQLRKGYKLRNRLLRPASVIVAKQPVPENHGQA